MHVLLNDHIFIRILSYFIYTLDSRCYLELEPVSSFLFIKLFGLLFMESPARSFDMNNPIQFGVEPGSFMRGLRLRNSTSAFRTLTLKSLFIYLAKVQSPDSLDPGPLSICLING